MESRRLQKIALREGSWHQQKSTANLVAVYKMSWEQVKRRRQGGWLEGTTQQPSAQEAMGSERVMLMGALKSGWRGQRVGLRECEDSKRLCDFIRVRIWRGGEPSITVRSL